MNSKNSRKNIRKKRKVRISKKNNGLQDRPRMSIFRSAKHIYAQIIDDTKGHTITQASSLEKEIVNNSEVKNKKDAAVQIGKLVAERAIEKGIKKIVFDRNGFLYHGRVKAVSDGAREAGLIF